MMQWRSGFSPLGGWWGRGGQRVALTAKNSLIPQHLEKFPPSILPPPNFYSLSTKSWFPDLIKIFKFKPNFYVLISYSFDPQVMLILILIDVQYPQNAVFSFEKGSNCQNHSSSGSHHPVKNLSKENFWFPPTPYCYLENPADLISHSDLVI